MKKIDKNVDKNSEKYREYQLKKAAAYKISIFLIVLCVGAVISLIVPLRPHISTMENRTLTSFPSFQLTSFLEGDYFEQIDTWFSDTFPFRDTLIGWNEEMTNCYGITSTSLHGEVVTGDEIPDVDISFDDVHELENTENVTSLEQGSNVSADTDSESTEQIEADDIGTEVEDQDGSVVAQTGERLDSIFVVGDSAYNYYAFSQTCSETYANLISSLADKLSGKAELYDMIVPTSIDITLDDATRNSLSSSNQEKAIKYMYSLMSSNVKKTYIYDMLKLHRSEYVYYRTDHHWTALGAYYAYTTLMNQMGKTPNSLDAYEEVEYTGFKGSFFTQSGAISLTSNPDTVYAYKPLSTNEMELMNSQGEMVNYKIITDVTNWSASSKYSTFIGGDNAFSHISNSSQSDGSKCLVIKESYGNALVPFLTDHYQDLYIVDYRYYSGNVSDLVEEYGIDTVIVINNVSATSTEQRITDMERVLQ